MIPPVTTPALAPKPVAPQAPPTANKTVAPPAPDTARASIGESAAGNLRAETARAIDAPEQAAVLPRLRDQETSEQSARLPRDADKPTGPPPAFDESPLERQARVALEPEDVRPDPGAPPEETPPQTRRREAAELAPPPPGPRERAEVSFAETRAIASAPEKLELDLST